MIANDLIYNLLDNQYLSPFYCKNQTKDTSSISIDPVDIQKTPLLFLLIRKIESKNHLCRTRFTKYNLIYLPTIIQIISRVTVDNSRSLISHLLLIRVKIKLRKIQSKPLSYYKCITLFQLNELICLVVKPTSAYGFL